MRPITTDATQSEVCVSVCLRVDHIGALCTNGWTDLDNVWG